MVSNTRFEMSNWYIKDIKISSETLCTLMSYDRYMFTVHSRAYSKYSAPWTVILYQINVVVIFHLKSVYRNKYKTATQLLLYTNDSYPTPKRKALYLTNILCNTYSSNTCLSLIDTANQ